MKKFLSLLAVSFACILVLGSCEESRIRESKLPEAAQDLIGRYFPGIKVKYAEKEIDDGIRTYNVKLADGTEIEFNEAGEWTEIDCDFATIPDGVLPEKISGYIAANYPQTKAYKAEKKFGGYEITVTGGYKLFFNNNGDFIR